MAKFRSTEPITRENFWARALMLIRVSDLQKIPAIKPDSSTWAIWRQYFIKHLGFYPWVMREVEKGRQEEMTVPTISPEEFDCTFEYDPTIPVLDPSRDNPGRRRIALCHAWLRAYEAGVARSDDKIRSSFAAAEIEAAKRMTIWEACEIMPSLRKKLSKPIGEYSTLMDWKLPARMPPSPKEPDKTVWQQAAEMNAAAMRKEEDAGA